MRRLPWWRRVWRGRIFKKHIINGFSVCCSCRLALYTTLPFWSGSMNIKSHKDAPPIRVKRFFWCHDRLSFGEDSHEYFLPCLGIALFASMLAVSLFSQTNLSPDGIFIMIMTYAIAFTLPVFVILSLVIVVEFLDGLKSLLIAHRHLNYLNNNEILSTFKKAMSILSSHKMPPPTALLKMYLSHIGYKVFILQCFVLPLLLTSFTISKITIPHIWGFSWDAYFSSLDHFLFGDDAWRILHSFIDKNFIDYIESLYMPLWCTAMFYAPLLVFFSKSTDKRNNFLLSYCLAWVFCGIILASVFASAGPVFTHMFDPTLAKHFNPLLPSLRDNLSEDSVILQSQQYLAGNYLEIRLGGGISAMPSLHIIIASLYVLFFYKTRYFWGAIFFLLCIIMGSIYFGYHYAIEAPVCIILALFIWTIASFIMRTLTNPTRPPQESLVE
jgi:hypothetical protein